MQVSLQEKCLLAVSGTDLGSELTVISVRLWGRTAPNHGLFQCIWVLIFAMQESSSSKPHIKLNSICESPRLNKTSFLVRAHRKQRNLAVSSYTMLSPLLSLSTSLACQDGWVCPPKGWSSSGQNGSLNQSSSKMFVVACPFDHIKWRLTHTLLETWDLQILLPRKSRQMSLSFIT